jgi:lambda family phage minor tail protein L
MDGIEANGDGTAIRPTFSVGNVSGRITALCLAFEDLLDFQITMRQTLGTYLDAANFPAGNPSADPTQESLEVWYIDQKTSENGESVSWELASPGDIGGESVGRQMTTLCHWRMTGGYRGADCGWTGGYFDKDGNATDNPELDECNGTTATGCKVRWGVNEELPFGGFPAVSLIARS